MAVATDQEQQQQQTPNPDPNAGGGGEQHKGKPAGEQQQQQQTQQGGKTYTYTEDRSDWVPRTRINELNGKHKTDLKTLQDRLDEQDRRFKAAFGIDENGQKKEAEIAETRAAMLQVLGLTEEELTEIKNGRNAVQTAEAARWEGHAESMFVDLETEVAKAVGIDKLAPTQIRQLRAAYRAAAEDCVRARRTAAQNQDATYDVRNDFLSRHERGDRALLKEFATAFLGDWFEHGKRQGTVTVQRKQRPVPSGGRTGTPVTKVAEMKVGTDDEFRAAMAAARQANQ